MKIFRKMLLALLVLAALRVPCFAQEAFHGAYLQGFPDGSIRPEKQVTRAELAEILNRILGRTDDKPGCEAGAHRGKRVSGRRAQSLGI